MKLNFKYFIFLNALDVLTTYFGITYLHLTEKNNFANGLFQEYGLITGLIGLKLVGLIVLWGILNYHCLIINKFGLNIKNEIKQPLITLGCILFVFVVLNNIYQIMKV